MLMVKWHKISKKEKSISLKKDFQGFQNIKIQENRTEFKIA